MAVLLHLMFGVPRPFTTLLLGIVMLMAGLAFLVAQPPPPGRDDPKAVERRIEEIRNWLERNPPGNREQKELSSFVQRYLDEAAAASNAGRRFQAQRFTDAADACRRPIDHLQHLSLIHISEPTRQAEISYA